MPYRIVSNRTMILLSILIFCVTANAQHALLVGVSRYPALSEKFQLKGPPNDVALMKRLLIEKFDFPDNEDVIRILSEAEGIKNSSRLPTRENICREFTRLSKITQNGENVVVFMAGHGSQQPQNVEDEYPEQDGLDQIFLPRDTGPWKDGLEGRGVQNCITDNEISKWLRQISAKGAHIWAIFDCCHSGDITRGVGETERYIPEGNDGLAIPESSIAKSNKKRGQSRLILDHGVMEVGRQDNLALLYACQRNEKAVERNLPFSNSDSHYGLLTYCLNSVLSRTEGDLSYQELGKRIHLEYINLGRTSGPTPLVEGADIARSVLGNDTIHRSLITVTLDARMRKLKVDAGQLQGITSNSILAVYPPPGEKRLEKGNQELKPIGYLRIEQSDVAYAYAIPCAFADLPPSKPDQLIGGRCEITELDCGSLRIGVAVDPTDKAGIQIPDQVRKTLEEILQEIGNSEGSLVLCKEIYTDADWLIRYDDQWIFLVPVTAHSVLNGSIKSDQYSSNQEIRLIRIHSNSERERIHQEINTALNRVARARNLLKLAALSSNNSVMQGLFEVDFNIEIQKNGEKSNSHLPIRAKSGDVVQFLVHNKCNVPFDLTLLYVDSRFGITALFPQVGENNRFYPGNSKVLPAILMNAETSGREYLIAIAHSAKGQQPVSFANLEQPTIERYRNLGRSEKSKLQDLLEYGLYGEGATRAASRAEVSNYQMNIISFDVSEPTPP